MRTGALAFGIFSFPLLFALAFLSLFPLFRVVALVMPSGGDAIALVNLVMLSPLYEELGRLLLLTALFAWRRPTDRMEFGFLFGFGFGFGEFLMRVAPAAAAVIGAPLDWAPAFDRALLAAPPADVVLVTLARVCVIAWHGLFGLLLAQSLVTRRVGPAALALLLHWTFNLIGFYWEGQPGWIDTMLVNLVLAGLSLWLAFRLLDRFGSRQVAAR